MSFSNSQSFYKKFVCLAATKNKAQDLYSKYLSFLQEIYSFDEAEEKSKKIEEKLDKLKHKIELRNLFLIDFSCLLLFALIGLQWGFEKHYADLYTGISLAVVIFLILLIFAFIHRNKISYFEEQLVVIKASFGELSNPAKYYDRLGVDVLKITLGKEISSLTDTEQSGNLLPRLVMLRKSLADELGYIIPNVRVLRSFENEPKEYEIWVRGKLVAKGDVSDKQDFLDEADVIIQHLKKVVIEHVEYVFSIANVQKISDLVALKDAKMVASMSEYIEDIDIKNILVGILKKNRSIKDISFIYQKIADYARFTEENSEIIDKIKADLDKLNKIGKDLL